MNQRCARCEKTVYPTEELKCLDKVWHKLCFKCQECSMTLNMRTYKGFNKWPYCEPHVPKAQATVVAETLELKRIQENTKLQSNAIYHAEFEKSRGKFTQVADDPELQRIKQNTKIISNVSYHGDLERKAQMEQKRSFAGEEDPQHAADDHQHSPRAASGIAYSQHQHSQPFSYNSSDNTKNNSNANSQSLMMGQQQQRQSNNVNNANWSAPTIPHQQQQQHQPVSTSMNNSKSNVQQQYRQQNNGKVGNNHSPYSARQQGSSTLVYTSDKGQVAAQPTRQVGSISEYDPVNHYYGSATGGAASGKMMDQNRVVNNSNNNYSYDVGSYQNANSGSSNNRMMMSSQHNSNTPQSMQSCKVPSYGEGRDRVFRAMYDYEASDADEVSFRNGDIIVDCSIIDGGWMMGTIRRTGQTGMVPANYVEPVS